MKKKKKIALSKQGLSLNTYGYTYSFWDFLATLVVFCIAGYMLCYLHKLNNYYTMGVMITIAIALPILITSYFMNKHEKNRFEEYCKYFEYMKIYFKTYKKIKLALEEVIVLFDEKSHMRKCLQSAIDEINTTGDYVKALDYIDKDYHTSYLERFHALLVTGERHGSDTIYENLDLINYDEWKSDIQSYQSKKKLFRWFLYGMTLFSFILSVYGIKMFMEDMQNVFKDPQYQLYTFLNIDGMLIIFMGVYINMVNKKWIGSDD